MTNNQMLMARGILAQCLAEMAHVWTCPECGHEGNCGISEMCDGCGEETIPAGWHQKFMDEHGLNDPA